MFLKKEGYNTEPLALRMMERRAQSDYRESISKEQGVFYYGFSVEIETHRG